MKLIWTDVCSHGEFRLHVRSVGDTESLSARKLWKSIHWGILSDGSFKNEIHLSQRSKETFQDVPWVSCQVSHRVVGSWRQSEPRCKPEFRNSQAPAMTAFISMTNAFSFVTVMKVLPEPEPNALQIPPDHTEDCRGSMVWNGSHSAIRPIPWVHSHTPLSPLILYPHRGWVGVVSVLWGWQSVSFFPQ